MGFLKKLGRGIKKVAQKNRGGVGRLIKKVGPGLAMAAVGATAPALVVKAASAAKSLGKKVRGLETPKSLVPVVRAAQVKVKKTRSKMPGGAPMPPMIGTPTIGMMSSTPQAKRTLYAKKKAPARRKRLYVGKAGTPSFDAMMKAKTQKEANAVAREYMRSQKKPKRKMTKPPSAKQLAARERFKAMVAARRKAS